MKRKILAVCLAFGITAALAGCGGSAKESASSNATAASQSQTAADAVAEETYGYDAEIALQEESGEMDAGAGTAADASGAESGIGNTVEAENPVQEASTTQKLIKTVNMSVETTEFDQFTAGVKTETEQIGGYVESSEVSSTVNEHSDRWANFTLRIPSEKLDEFVSRVGEDANVTYTNESTEDVTLSYVDMESHLKALRTEQETLMSMLEKVESLEDILKIQSQLTEVRYRIESYESQLRTYDNLVDYSTVYLNVSEVTRETSVAGITFGERVKTRFNDNVYRIGQGFRNFAIAFLGAIPILIILAVIAVAALLLLRKVYKIRKKRKEKEESDQS